MNIFKHLPIFIFAIIFITVITVIIFITITTKSSTSSNTPTTQKPIGILPSTHYELRTTPSPVPPADFTGAEAIQQLPDTVKNIGEQKTALRRLTPLTLSFGTVEFDYENDMFLVQLFDPREQSLNQFTSWRTQTYPALTEDKFIVY